MENNLCLQKFVSLFFTSIDIKEPNIELNYIIKFFVEYLLYIIYKYNKYSLKFKIIIEGRYKNYFFDKLKHKKLITIIKKQRNFINYIYNFLNKKLENHRYKKHIILTTIMTYINDLILYFDNNLISIINFIDFNRKYGNKNNILYNNKYNDISNCTILGNRMYNISTYFTIFRNNNNFGLSKLNTCFRTIFNFMLDDIVVVASNSLNISIDKVEIFFSKIYLDLNNIILNIRCSDIEYSISLSWKEYIEAIHTFIFLQDFFTKLENKKTIAHKYKQYKYYTKLKTISESLFLVINTYFLPEIKDKLIHITSNLKPLLSQYNKEQIRNKRVISLITIMNNLLALK